MKVLLKGRKLNSEGTEGIEWIPEGIEQCTDHGCFSKATWEYCCTLGEIVLKNILPHSPYLMWVSTKILYLKVC